MGHDLCGIYAIVSIALHISRSRLKIGVSLDLSLWLFRLKLKPQKVQGSNRNCIRFIGNWSMWSAHKKLSMKSINPNGKCPKTH